MQLYSTNDKSHIVSLEEAVFRGLPPDNGLYLPTSIPILPKSFIGNLHKFSMNEIAVEVCKTLFKDYISDSDVERIVNEAITFDAPLVKLHDNIYSLELFHGPTLAFKDFGARFMAQLMGYFLEKAAKEIHIIVATSGDTGGAVASGFYKTKGIKVTILYPQGKVSELQEKQLTTLGENITALEIDGTFDDCQKLVKTAFLDNEVTSKINLSSANSINIARLIPQMFYYFNTIARLQHTGLKTVFSVPSGNFGNICAGMIAMKMGLPIHHFVASVNANDTFVQFLFYGEFKPKPSVQTISNAMDVGNPSNFTRIYELFGNDINALRTKVDGYSIMDDDTRKAVREIYENYHYTMDPHGAVGYLGLKKYLSSQAEPIIGVVLHTAHPAKFLDTYDANLKSKIALPKALADLVEKKKVAIKMKNKYADFKTYLLN
ncbi:MAG: threonine synthase [Cytophagales bacterium]